MCFKKGGLSKRFGTKEAKHKTARKEETTEEDKMRKKNKKYWWKRIEIEAGSERTLNIKGKKKKQKKK